MVTLLYTHYQLQTFSCFLINNSWLSRGFLNYYTGIKFSRNFIVIDQRLISMVKL